MRMKKRIRAFLFGAFAVTTSMLFFGAPLPTMAANSPVVQTLEYQETSQQFTNESVTVSGGGVKLAKSEKTSETGTSAINKKMGNLKDLVFSFISSVGSIIAMWGFFEVGMALQSSEGSLTSNAFKRIGGGVIMILSDTLLSAIG